MNNLLILIALIQLVTAITAFVNMVVSFQHKATLSKIDSLVERNGQDH